MTEGLRGAGVRPKLQWRNRLARGTYMAVRAERCRGCEFDPHLEQFLIFLLPIYKFILINQPKHLCHLKE